MSWKCPMCHEHYEVVRSTEERVLEEVNEVLVDAAMREEGGDKNAASEASGMRNVALRFRILIRGKED